MNTQENDPSYKFVVNRLSKPLVATEFVNTPETEWEKKAIDAIVATYPEDIWPEPEYKPHDAEVSWVMRQMSKATASILRPIVEDLLTSRDTYWKERVREIKEKVERVRLDVDVIKCDCGEPYKDSDLDLSVGELEQALDALLDNLK